MATSLYSNFSDLTVGNHTDKVLPPTDDRLIDCVFVSPPPTDLFCRVCRLLLRDPYQAQCCGSHYCGYCLQQQLNANSRCTFCSSRHVPSFRDVSVTQRINQLQVKCSNECRGCRWIGELGSLGSHLKACEKKPATCKRCGEAFSKDAVRKHEKNECPKRNFICPYCKEYSATLEEVRDLHWPQCLLYPIMCPNECSKFYVPRKDVLRHLREECEVRKGFGELTSALAKMKEQLKERDAEVTELRIKVSQNPKMRSLEKDNAELATRIMDIQRKRAELFNENLGLSEAIVFRDKRIQELETQNYSLKSNLSHMENDLNTQLQAMKTLCEQIREEKTLLEVKLASLTDRDT